MGKIILNCVASMSIAVLSTLNIQQMVNGINTVLLLISLFFHPGNTQEKNHLSLNAFHVLTLIAVSSFSFPFFPLQRSHVDHSWYHFLPSYFLIDGEFSKVSSSQGWGKGLGCTHSQ